MLRWMKVIVLIAGAIGALGFFRPFIEFEVGTKTVPASAYRLLVGFDDPDLKALELEELTPRCVKQALPVEMGAGVAYSCADHPSLHHSFVPFYFISSVVLLLIGGIAVFRRRIGGLLGLFTLAASLLALGGWLRELKLDRVNVSSWTALGATLLGISGVLGLLATLVVLIWREPHPIRKKPVIKTSLPHARIVR